VQEQKYPVKRNAEIELSIEKTAFGGNGLGKYQDYVIFVKNTLPGDVVMARVFKRKANYAEAKLIELLKPSPLRIEAPCIYFSWCGGCTWQNISYNDQLNIKKEHVGESLDHLAQVTEPVLFDPVPSKKIWGYRNKMEFSFADRRWLLPHELNDDSVSIKYALGMHVPGAFDKILDIDECLLQSEAANKVLQMVDKYCIDKKITPYGIKSHDGYMRYLVIRESHYTGEIMVNLVTAFRDEKMLNGITEYILNDVPEVTSIVNNINPKKAQIAVGVEEFLIHGNSFITEKLGPFEFRISANSFFQTNTAQAEELYHIVLEYAELTGKERVWDLYCGTGTITLYLSQKSNHVTGFEISDSAIADAESNALDHKCDNTKFISGDLLKNLDAVSSRPDVIVTDPPRSGMHPKVCEKLAEIGAARIVYVSCNPTTLARDIKLMQHKYQLIKAQPVDMFPHTYHIETVALLEKI
jgi:23S rRNA (uracil1939-C5)-methyltransferase